MLEETGVAIEPASLRVVAVETTPDRQGGSDGAVRKRQRRATREGFFACSARRMHSVQ
jgi:hypothetical protein